MEEARLWETYKQAVDLIGLKCTDPILEGYGRREGSTPGLASVSPHPGEEQDKMSALPSLASFGWDLTSA